VLRHEIDYARPALLHDVLVAKTWVGLSEGVRSERHVEFHHLDTGALIAKAKTTWCLLDATSMRPKRVEEVVGIFT
jgi:acyl-CoA thioester hydrolase